jgi:hypothetical protein
MYSLGYSYTLDSDIPAIQILPSESDGFGLSPVSKLPQGAEVAPCGNGFDLHTLKVRYQGHYYYVFRRDLCLADPVISRLN